LYALLALITAGVEACLGAVSRGVGKARRRRAISRAEPLTGNKAGNSREVTGRAVAGPAGPVNAPLSGRSCAWYAVVVRERYRAWRPGPLGPTKVERHLRLAEHTSGPLHVTGDTATVRVDPRGADLDLGEPEFAEFIDRGEADTELAERLAQLLGTPPRPRHRDRSVGLVVEEWVVAADDPLYVVGSARSELGDLVIGKSAMRPLIISRAAPVPAGDPDD
jgi:E3 Ubiquitin ligase